MQENDKNVYVTKTLVEKTEFSELDFDLYDEFRFSCDEDNDFIEIEKGRGYADTYPIKIEKLIEKLQSLKEKGSTHVELSYLCDHIGYNIDGYKMELSNNKDISDYKIKNKFERDKYEKIKKLQDEIRQIERT